MEAQIKTISGSNYEVIFTTEFDTYGEMLDCLPNIEAQLANAGYLPTGEAPHSPEGLPLCVKHGEVMREREKQGDTWYSHSVIDPNTGEKVFCKGRPGKDSPGWYTTDARKPETPKASGSGSQGGGQPAKSQAQPRQAEAPKSAPAAAKGQDNSPTAYWTLATALVEAGRVTLAQAGEIAQQPGTWAEKAARLHL